MRALFVIINSQSFIPIEFTRPLIDLILVFPYKSSVSSARHLGKQSLFRCSYLPDPRVARSPLYTSFLKVTSWGLSAAHILRHVEMARQTLSRVPSSA